MVEKQVKIKVITEADSKELEDLSKKLKELDDNNIEVDTDVDDSEIKKTSAEIDNLNDTANVDVNVEDGEIDSARTKEENLNDTANVDVDVDDSEIKQADDEIDELNKNVKVGIELEGLDAIKSGFESVKQGASQLKNEFNEILTSAGRMEQTEAFLRMNLNDADAAKKKLDEIRSVTDALPGDDVALQNLLSQAAIKDLTLGKEEFTQMGHAAADYMAAMQNFGKTSIETQQDLMNYILAGNTAEIERSPILQAHVDKLKEGTTIQERSKLLKEALTAENWEGIASQNIYNNKIQSFNDLLERGKMNLGAMFLQPTKDLMVYIGKLDEASGGIIGMSVAAASMATPLIDTGAGLGQMIMGIQAIKGLGFIQWMRNLELTTKLAKIAQLELNLAFLTNPIFLVVAAIIALIVVLGYLYFNNEQVRAAIDGLGQSFVALGQWIYTGAIYWLEQLQLALENLWNYIFTLGGLLPENVAITGNSVVDTIIRVLLFIATLPIQLGMIFMNVIAQTLGFGSNFSQRMINAAANAINGFINYIRQLPGIVMGEFNRVLGMVNNFINTLPDRVWDMGKAIIDALKASLGINSPGYMYYILRGEMERLENLPDDFNYGITRNVTNLGSSVVDAFNPKLNGVEFNDLNTPSMGSDERNSNYGGQVFNVTFEGCTFDKKERVNEVLDILNNYFSWNNATAGRTK